MRTIKTTVYALFLILLITVASISYIYRSDVNNDRDSIFTKVGARVTDVKTALDLKSYFEAKDTKRTFLILFQNDMEMRPGGGYIGSFGIITIENGEVISTDSYNSLTANNYSGPYPAAPIQFKEWLGVPEDQFMNSNWSPDFETNVEHALELYDKFSNENSDLDKNFDAVLGINTQVLNTLIEFSGPIEIEGYKFTKKDANDVLEKAVGHDHVGRGKNIVNRKDIMRPLAEEILNRIQSLGKKEMAKLADQLFDLMDEKDIMVYSFDERIQAELEKQDWAGKVNQTHDNDYLMVVDANMGGLKADPYINRKADYSVDFSGERPVATLKLSYNYDAPGIDWRTPETFQFYARAYVPNGSRLISIDGNVIGDEYYENELNKQIFGIRVHLHMHTTEEFIIKYELPERITETNYDLLIERQSGVDREITTSVK